MTNKKISIIKAFALAILSVALVFCAVGSMLNATAAESRISSITIEIDYGDYDANDLPKGKAGKSYPVFAFVATDNEGATVTETRVTVKDPNGEILSQRGGRFATDAAGEYTIEYVAVSGIVHATKKITLTVEEYTDTMVYNSDGEGVPSAAETGEVVIADLGTFSGGVGDLTYKTALKLGEAEIAFTETSRGIYFIPDRSGVYTLVYTACDFVADEKSEKRTITVTDGENPVMQTPSIPASAVSGETIKLPLPDGILYHGGEKYYLPVKVYFDETEVGTDMQVKNLVAGEHTIKYECVSPIDAGKKTEYAFTLTVKDKTVADGARLFDNYFDFVNCEPVTTENREYAVEIGKTEEASFAFSREIPVDYLNFEISTTAGTSSYSQIYFVMTDAKNASDKVMVRIRRLSSYDSLYISYDDATGSVFYGESGEESEKITSYSDGRTFAGFRSGKAYISFEVRGVKKDTEFVLRKIASNAITTDSSDYAAPEFLTNNDYRAVYVSYIGHSIYLPELKAFDVLDNDVTVTLTLYGDDGTIYEGKGGYTFDITKSGEYMAEYVAVDSYGNQKPQISTIYVGDLESPVIKVSGIKATVKVGQEITLPKAKITDNDTSAEEITSYVYVVKGNNQKKLLGDTYKFTEAGEYKIRYSAYDKNQNYTVVEFTVICK